MLSLFHRKPPIEEFWQWFKSNRQRLLLDGADQAAHKQFTQQIKRLHRSMTYEITYGDPNELHISADGVPELIPLVNEVVAAAPQIDGWKVVAFRQARRTPVTIDVFDSTMDAQSLIFAIDGVHGNSVDITVFLKSVADEHVRHLAHCAMMIIESVIGEYSLMTQIGELEYGDESDSIGRELFPVTELPAKLASL